MPPVQFRKARPMTDRCEDTRDMHHSSGKSAGATRTLSLVVRGLFPHGLRNRSRCHRCEQPLRVDAPPTGWVTALAGLLARGSLPCIRPSRFAGFPVLQWSSADEGSPLTVAGAATDYCDIANYNNAATVFPLSPPARPGEPTRGRIISMVQLRVKTMHDNANFPAEITRI